MKVLIGFLVVAGALLLLTRNHESLKGNVDYDNGVAAGVMLVGQLDPDHACRMEAISRYAMRGDDPDAKVASQRFEIGCKDGAKGH